jgi:hypothetical protein
MWRLVIGVDMACVSLSFRHDFNGGTIFVIIKTTSISCNTNQTLRKKKKKKKKKKGAQILGGF